MSTNAQHAIRSLVRALTCLPPHTAQHFDLAWFGCIFISHLSLQLTFMDCIWWTESIHLLLRDWKTFALQFGMATVQSAQTTFTRASPPPSPSRAARHLGCSNFSLMGFHWLLLILSCNFSRFYFYWANVGCFHLLSNTNLISNFSRRWAFLQYVVAHLLLLHYFIFFCFLLQLDHFKLKGNIWLRHELFALLPHAHRKWVTCWRFSISI